MQIFSISSAFYNIGHLYCIMRWYILCNWTKLWPERKQQTYIFIVKQSFDILGSDPFCGYTNNYNR